MKLDFNKSTQRAQPPPTPKFQPELMQDSNPDLRINPDPDVCGIRPENAVNALSCCISHFVTYGTNRPLIVWEMLTKIPHRNGKENEKIDQESTRRSGSPRNVTSRGSSIAHVCQIWSPSVSAFVSYLVCRITDGFRIRIFGLIRIRMSVRSVPKRCGCIMFLASVSSPSTVQAGRWLYEKC